MSNQWAGRAHVICSIAPGHLTVQVTMMGLLDKYNMARMRLSLVKWWRQNAYFRILTLCHVCLQCKALFSWVNSFLPGKHIVSNWLFFNVYLWMIVKALGVFFRSLMIISQHWIRKWLDAIRHKTITSSNADIYLWCYTSPRYLNELN